MVRPFPAALGLFAAVLLTLAACSGHKAADEADGANAASTPAKVRQKTVFDDQLKALDKAKAVEKQLQEDREKADQAIEDAGG